MIMKRHENSSSVYIAVLIETSCFVRVCANASVAMKHVRYVIEGNLSDSGSFTVRSMPSRPV